MKKAKNFNTSTDNLIARLQIYENEWRKVTEVSVRPGNLYNSSSLSVTPAYNFRLKLYSAGGNGGVYGRGSVFDY
ncbi:MAG: hypothetical protein ACM3S4_02665 [Burkholderiales bacterium]